MELAEAKTKAVSGGTAQRNKMDKTIGVALIALGVVAALFASTWWMMDLVYSDHPVAVADGDSNTGTITLGVVPVDLTEGGTRRITLHILDNRGCVDTYDKNMIFLVTDCKGEFHDLRGLGPTYYASNGSDQVKVQYKIW